jgi:enoyl-CoA hydratase
MTSTQVNLKTEGSHAAITFRTDGGLNILTTDVLHTFGAVVAKVRRDPHIRTASIQAEGKVFIAGADIREMADFTPEQARAYGELGQGIFNDLAALPCITVAAIQGAALGGGLELTLACDFRLAVKSAKLGCPEVSLGLIPGWGGIARLTKLVGSARAKRLFLSGNPVSGEDALAWGLVDEVANSPEDLNHRVAAFCKSFRRAAPAAAALAKRAARDFDELSAFAECFSTTDAQEGMAAFVEKRPASWMEG